MPTNRYFKTDRVFHESFLKILEDSVEKNPDLTQEGKDKINTVLYHDFFNTKERKNIISFEKSKG